MLTDEAEAMAETKKRIVIAEDHAIIRDSLRMLLSCKKTYEVVGEAADGLDAIRSVQSQKPDLIVMDLSMPRMDGLRAILEIKRLRPFIKILVLTVHTGDDNIFAALSAGADGYLLKDDTHGELMLAIENIFSGKSFISAKISRKVIDGYVEERGSVRLPVSCDALTQRETEILKMVAEGYKNKEIADFLCISSKTVEKHRANLMKKLDMHSASSLTAFAIGNGMTQV